MSQTALVLLPIVALLIGVVLELGLARLLSPKGKGWLAFACSLIGLGGVLAIWPVLLREGAAEATLLTWDGPVALAYHVDGLSLLFALMAAGIGAAVLLYSVDDMAHDPATTRFYVLMLLFIAGLIHLVYSADLFLLYVSWETIGLCSFLLVGFWYRQREAAAGARKVLTMTHIAGYGLLAAILLLYARTGTTLWTDPRVAAAFGSGLFLLTLLAAMAKSVQFPLHTWIPDAMAAPTPVSALLHAACYVKAGVYWIARLHSLGPWPVAWQTTVTWVGTITLVVGALYAMVQSDLKRLLAFSTVSQIGYMVLGLGLGTPLGLTAGLLHCLNHGLFKGGLFLCAGAVQHGTGTRDIDRLGGLARRMPAITLLWLVGAGSITGVPLLSGFVSKWLLYNAALAAGQVVPALIAWSASVLTVFYFLKATAGVFLGDETPETAQAHRPPTSMRAGAAVLAAGSLLLGIAPQVAVLYILNPLLPALGARPVVTVSWLGLTAGEGSWFTTGGLILALVAVGVGGLLYQLLRPTRRTVPAAAGGVFTGGEPLSGPARLSARDFSLIVQEELAPLYRWADVDRCYLALWRAILAMSEWMNGIGRWLERHALPAIVLLTLLVALVGRWVPAPTGSLPHTARGMSRVMQVGIGAALLGLLLAGAGGPGTRRLWPLMAAAGLPAVAGLGVEHPIGRPLLLEGASLVTLALVWRTARERRAARAYLLAVLLSAALLLVGAATLEMGSSPSLSRALLLPGLALKLALIPLYLWLPLMAATTSPPVVGLVVAVVDVAAFGEVLALREVAELFAPPTPWLILAVLSSLGGALLMLAQRDLKRMLAFSTVEDMGYLLLGVTLGGEWGMEGAVLGATVHALAKALLFASLVAPEAEEGPTPAARGLAGRYPLSGVGFLVGALAMLGVPPTMGYPARWRLYEAAAQASPWLLAVLLVASAMALLAYIRAVAVCWWGGGEESRKREPVPLAVALVGLSGALLLFGLWPALVGH